LASNSLLDGLVFGARAAKAALTDAEGISKGSRIREENGPVKDWKIQPDIFQTIRAVMSEKVGIIRTGSELKAAIESLRECEERATNAATKNFVTVALLVARGALFRQESRGAHFRTDYPQRDEAGWRVHSAQRLGQEPFVIPVGKEAGKGKRNRRLQGV
jgi:L-aspartate oxidase